MTEQSDERRHCTQRKSRFSSLDIIGDEAALLLLKELEHWVGYSAHISVSGLPGKCTPQSGIIQQGHLKN